MSASMIFNLYVPDNSYFSGSPTPENLVIPNYQSGKFLSIFSGSYISSENTKYWSDFGIGIFSTGNSTPINLYINNNTYLSTGSDVEYNVTINNFIVGIPISFYSASNISNISSLTITNFISKEE